MCYAKRIPYQPCLSISETNWPGINSNTLLNTWLIRHLGAADTLTNRIVGRLFLVGNARRQRIPGVRFETCLILEGNSKKASEAIRTIAGGGYRRAPFSGLTHAARALMSDGGATIIEGTGLETLSENSAAKALHGLISRGGFVGEEERYRRFVFAACTEGEYRAPSIKAQWRWHRVPIGRVALARLARDRAELIRQADEADISGEPIWLHPCTWVADGQQYPILWDRGLQSISMDRGAA